MKSNSSLTEKRKFEFKLFPVLQIPYLRKLFPVILGYDGARIVESIGPGLSKFIPVDKVITPHILHSGKYKFSLSLCLNLCLIADRTSWFTYKGRQIYHFMECRLFPQDTNLVKTDDDETLVKVCLIGCGFSTGYGGVSSTAKIVHR
ncbi:alcohol dehydrogenase class-2 isozyme 1-like [Notamacropus eugenii]|uniref:alcohol dehydrogenase class-2 isozyme 1-like n=1 Tax=Notamacropus eugenii TaxID=9315 RepID=UPI003B67971E